jgi:hypothetical protein
VTCCTPNQRCGVAYAATYGATCLARNQPGVDDDTCPDGAGRFGFFPAALQGCCRDNDVCGLRSTTGAGCVDAGQLWTAMQDGFGAYLYNGPFMTGVACDYPD